MPRSGSVDDTSQPDLENTKVSPVRNQNKRIEMSGDVSSLESVPRETSNSLDKAAPRDLEPRVVQVNHRHRNRGLFGMTMLKSSMVGGTGLCLCGGLAYFASQWLEIPGLNGEIDRLGKEVDRLSLENDR